MARRMHDLGKYTAAPRQVPEKASVEVKKKKNKTKESNDFYKSEDNYTIRMLSSGVTKDVSGR